MCESHSLKIVMLSVQPGPRDSNDLRVGRKNGDLSIVIQSREQVVVRQGQIRRIRWVIKTLKAQVGQFLLGCKCPLSRGIVVQELDSLGDHPMALTFFLQNVLQLHQQRCQYSVLIVWPFGRQAIKRMPSWSQNIEARTFPVDFCTLCGFFGGREGVSHYAATPLIVALSPGHCDITRLRPWSPIATATENHLDRA